MSLFTETRLEPVRLPTSLPLMEVETTNCSLAQSRSRLFFQLIEVWPSRNFNTIDLLKALGALVTETLWPACGPKTP